MDNELWRWNLKIEFFLFFVIYHDEWKKKTMIKVSFYLIFHQQSMKKIDQLNRVGRKKINALHYLFVLSKQKTTPCTTKINDSFDLRVNNNFQSHRNWRNPCRIYRVSNWKNRKKNIRINSMENFVTSNNRVLCFWTVSSVIGWWMQLFVPRRS